MPPILAKLAFNLLIMILQKTGILTSVEASAVKGADSFLRTVEHLKTYANNDQLDPLKSDFPAEVKSR